MPNVMQQLFVMNIESLLKEYDLSITAKAAIGYKEVIDYLFDPGFSMAKKVTDISGRGVGLDVVKSNMLLRIMLRENLVNLFVFIFCFYFFLLRL